MGDSLCIKGKDFLPLFTSEQALNREFAYGEDEEGRFVACRLANRQGTQLCGWYILVSPEDLRLMEAYSWCGNICGHPHDKTFLVRRREHVNGTQRDILLNKEIWERMTGEEASYVWRLGHPLDFRRSNLSDAPLRRGCRGVTWNREVQRWQAQITYGGRTRFIGTTREREDGYRMYNHRLRDLKEKFPRDLAVQNMPYNKIEPAF